VAVGAEVSSATAWQLTATCRGCGYALRDLPEPRCPECGRTFDPRDPRTMRVPGWKPPARWRPAPPARPQPFGEQALKLAFVATALCAAGVAGNCGVVLAALGFLAWIELIAACAIHAVIVTVRPPRDALQPKGVYRQWKWMVPLLLMLCPFVSYGPYALASDTCPHATYWSFGPIGVAHSIVGGPCGNHGGGVRLTDEWWLTGPEAIKPEVRYGRRR